MLCAIGDLLDDVVVWLAAQIAAGTDTPARTFHRRGGSAANVAAVGARHGWPTRFIGHVGADALGDRLTGELAAEGVDVRTQRGGRTGTVVVLVEPGGERTMLTDRGNATDLHDVPSSWLAGVGILHLTAYSLALEPMASTTLGLAAAARARGARLSIDASSVRVLHDLGPGRVQALLAELRPDVLLANAAEAAVLGLPGALPVGVGLGVVKQGPDPVLVVGPGQPPLAVPLPAIDDVADTTGAGDAFAAGFLGALLDGADVPAAVRSGHRLAGTVLGQPGAGLAEERR